jgi:hypothetical protein
LNFGLYLMAAAMIVGALLVHLLPRNASVDEAEQILVTAEHPAVGVP